MSALTPRAHFAALEETIYLNQASLGLVGQPAVDAMHAFLDDIGRHGNLHLSDEAEVALLDDLRDRAGVVLGCEPGAVALLASASELLGQAPMLLTPPVGGTVVLVATDFPAVTRPWLLAASRGGPEVVFVNDEPSTDLTAAILDAVDERTAVVCVGSVQFATGSRVDVPRLRAATRAVGADLVVDVTQAAGAEPITAVAWGADLVVASGYKWLGGHGGVAIAAVAESLLDRPPPLPGWMGTPEPFAFDATRLLLADGGRRYTQSTMSYVSVAGLTEALGELLAVEMDAITDHAGTLARRLVDGLESSGWQPFRDPADPGAADHIVSIARPDADATTSSPDLAAAGIVCSSRGGRIRVSLAHYNDYSDVDGLVTALTSMA